MNSKLKTGLAVAAIVATTAGVSWAQTPGGTKQDAPTRAVRAPGDEAVYVPITPCRVVDTRFAGGKLTASEVRTYRVYDDGSPTGFATQGGNSESCPIGTDSLAVEASVTAIDPTANGWFRAWPNGESEPTATYLNFTKGQNITNTGAISVSDLLPQDLKVKNYGGSTHYVIDIQGYYAYIPPAP